MGILAARTQPNFLKSVMTPITLTYNLLTFYPNPFLLTLGLEQLITTINKPQEPLLGDKNTIIFFKRVILKYTTQLDVF